MTTSTASPTYLVENILPTKRIHLLAGISSAGKSRWSTPAFIMWSMGMPVLGFKSHPVPWCLVCRDRPLIDAQDTIKGMGFELSQVPIIPAYGKHNKNLTGVMLEVERMKAKFLLWEGIDLMVENPNNPKQVDDFLSSLSAYCEDGLTVLGTTGVPKLKPSETYQNPRQLVAGSTIWERSTSTNLIIAPVDEKDVENPARVMYACLKNHPSFTVQGLFDRQGILTFKGWEERDKNLDTLLDDLRQLRRPRKGESLN